MTSDHHPTLPHIGATPFDSSVSTYTRFAGRELEPFEFAGWLQESMSWKRTCYIGDWSTLRKTLIRGPEAFDFLLRIGVNSFGKFEVGSAKHHVMCTTQGKVAAEGILMRLADDEFLLTSSPAVVWTNHLLGQERPHATGTEVTGDQFILQLQGPSSVEVLEKAAGESVRDLKFMRFRSVRVAGTPVHVLRQGMSGEIGYELHGPMTQGSAVYRALLEAGQEFGIQRLGGRTKMVNHVEACFPTPSVDFIPALAQELPADRAFIASPRTAGSFVYRDVSELYRSPVELGWSKNIKFDHHFRGEEVLKQEVAAPKRVIVTLIWNSEDVVDVYASLFRAGDVFQPMELPRNLLGCMHADAVLLDGRLVGVTTSRCYSYHFRQMISLCTIDADVSNPGIEVEVLWGNQGTLQKRIRAVVAPAPYKPDKRRLELNAPSGSTR